MVNEEIRTILAPLTDNYVMLPNSAVGEILEFASPEPFKQGPAWLLGEIAWNGWQVPVINYERMLKGTRTKITSKSRILIIKTLGESTQVNYIGLVIKGLPKLKKARAETLFETELDDLPDTVFSEVAIEGLKAIIPDLGDLTRTVEMAAYNN
ncbi:MAG: chemotaxis protein CheW [Xanthomonadales bacterium]|nr:chemotaxis protein CheW [Xanthomonadales bacterium]MDH4018395.1 chemotaxis protein CheW [Xanthomonadales bacterium]